jgi:hypothetical protein
MVSPDPEPARSIRVEHRGTVPAGTVMSAGQWIRALAPQATSCADRSQSPRAISASKAWGCTRVVTFRFT